VLLLVGPAALAVRDRWPVGTVAVTTIAVDVYVALGFPYGPIFLSVIVAMVSAVLAGHRRATWWVAATGYAGFVVATAVDPRADGLEPLHLSLVAGWLIGVLAIAEAVRGRRAQAAERARAARDEEERQLADQRLAVARELHDVLAHNISLINVQASVALHLLDEDPSQARPALVHIKAASREALQELRGALDLLRRGGDPNPAPRTPAPSLADLDRLVAGVRRSGLDVQLARNGGIPPLPAAVELAAYRIVQEALTNVTRHAGARAVAVEITYDDGVEIDVTDDGVGGPVIAGKGIAGMRERAAALGGTLDAAPVPSGGFRVHAHLPVGTP
jgi:signal transduction histidine kinase